MSLSVKDILILDFFDNKPLHTKIPDYKSDIYGKNAHERLLSLYNDGWIRHSEPSETLHMLPTKALSDFLLRHNEMCENKSRADLIRLIIQKIPQKAYAHAVPKVYIVTQKGRNAISHNMAYILNARENYGLSNSEISHWQSYLSQRGTPYNARTVIDRAMHDKASIFVMSGEWSKLRNLYYTLAHFYLRAKKDDDALSSLMLVFFLDLSGMRDDNKLVSYENLFQTQKGIILLIDELRLNLHISYDDLRTKFLSTIARKAPGLPFSYFSPQTSALILLERTRGIDFSPTKYIAQRNVPDPSAKSYKFERNTRFGSFDTPFYQKNKKEKKLYIPVFVPPNLEKKEQIKKPLKVKKAEKKTTKDSVMEKAKNLIASFFSE